MQVAAVVQLAAHTLQDRYPTAKKVVIQSYNAIGFSSQEIIPLIFNMNTRLRDEKNRMLIRWISTEAYTGKTQLDTHYSFLDKKFQSYVEDKNDILIEDGIINSISFNGDISGTTYVIVNAADMFGNRAFKIKTGTQETHEDCWMEDYVHVIK